MYQIINTDKSKKIESNLTAASPEDIREFHGVVDPEKLTGFQRWMIKNVEVPTGDLRDWEAIST